MEMDKDKIIAALAENKKVITQAVEQYQVKLSEIEKRLGFIESQFKPGERSKISIPGLKEEMEKKEFSVLKMIRGIRFGDWSDAGFEKEVLDAIAKDMGTATGSAGGYLVPVQYIAELIEMLRAEAIVIQLGATVLDNLKGSPVEIPKQTGGATAYWVGENSAITPSDLTLGQVNLTPHQVGCLVKLSNRLLKLATPSAEAMVRRDIAQALALAIDYAALRGSGTSNEPTGIANTSNINTIAIGANGGDFLFEHIVEMEGKLEDANALRGRLGIAWHGKVKRKLKKMRIPQYSGDSGGQYVMLPMSDAQLRDHIGYDFRTSTQIPTNLTKGSGSNLSEVYFGNWQELIIGQWTTMEFMASQETSDAFAKNQTWIRVISEVDIGLRHPESFCLCSDAKTT